MAKYSMELRKVCDIFTRQEVENWFKSYDLEDFLTPSQIQVLLNHNVWSKEKLAKKIVDHYFMREIGFETPALFKHYAKTTMNEIMEEYLLKIYTKFLEYDPLSSVDYVETFEREINSEGEGILSTNNSSNLTGNSSQSNSSTTENENEISSSSANTINSTTQNTENTTSSALEVNSDTPQTNISKQNLLNGNYASSSSATENSANTTNNTTINTTNNTTNTENGNSSSITQGSISSTNTENATNNSLSNNNTKSKTIEKYTHKMVGDNGVIVTNQYLVREFRELAISLDLEIINKLNTLFMGIY